MGITTPEKLRQKRPYVIVGTFVIGMFLTPPDIISQTLLALPMWVLFELGLVFSKGFVRKEETSEQAEEPVAAAVASSGVAPSGATGAGERPVGSDIDPAKEYTDPDRFVPLTDDEMEAELDVIEAEEDEQEPQPHAPPGNPAEVANKLEQVQALRREGKVSEARDLLYEVLEQGDEDQRMVARNILAQLDES
jgi:sec-independent protein translocase protein TatC